MIGKDGIEKAFGKEFSNRFNIHRTRQNFPGDGIDTFENMTEMGMSVTDKVIRDEMGGAVDEEENTWIIPLKNIN